MAGTSKPSKGFRPLDLMEGFSIQEVFETVNDIEDLMHDDFGDDQEMRVVVLSFLLGRALRTSRVSMQRAMAMCHSAREVAI